jgi:hypothetical protein
MVPMSVYVMIVEAPTFTTIHAETDAVPCAKRFQRKSGWI